MSIIMDNEEYPPPQRCIKHVFDGVEWQRTRAKVSIAAKSFAEGAFRTATKALLWDSDKKSKTENSKPQVVVVKAAKDTSTPRELYFNDVQAQVFAAMWAAKFNAKSPPLPIQFIDSYVLELVDSPGRPVCGAEAFIEGEFKKHNNNVGATIGPVGVNSELSGSRKSEEKDSIGLDISSGFRPHNNRLSHLTRVGSAGIKPTRTSGFNARNYGSNDNNRTKATQKDGDSSSHGFSEDEREHSFSLSNEEISHLFDSLSRQSGVYDSVKRTSSGRSRKLVSVGNDHLKRGQHTSIRKPRKGSATLERMSSVKADVLESQTAQAFSHFTFSGSKGRLLICDIQGVRGAYTDPQIHTFSGAGFGKGNLGVTGIRAFLLRHKCNKVCKAVKLVEIAAKNLNVDNLQNSPMLNVEGTDDILGMDFAPPGADSLRVEANATKGEGKVKEPPSSLNDDLQFETPELQRPSGSILDFGSASSPIGGRPRSSIKSPGTPIEALEAYYRSLSPVESIHGPENHTPLRPSGTGAGIFDSNGAGIGALKRQESSSQPHSSGPSDRTNTSSIGLFSSLNNVSHETTSYGMDYADEMLMQEILGENTSQ